jgi:electron transport complex protein RnfG
MSRVASAGIVLLVAGLGIGATYLAQQASGPRITAQQRLIDSRNLLDMLPADRYDNQPLDQALHLADVALAHSTLLGGYLATIGGTPSAVLLRSQTVGYAGTIELLIVIGANGTLLGVKTLKQSETPGLGALIGDWPNPWLQGFTGKSRSEPADNGWALNKDQGQFDQIAGATITSRAVVHAVHDALRYFDEHSPALLGGGPHE